MPKPTLKVSIGYASDKGIKPDNEDFFGSLIPEGPQLTHKGIAVAIADGMSGSDAGKQASHCCVISFLSDYYSTPDSWSVKHAGKKFFPRPIPGYTVRDKAAMNRPRAWSARSALLS